jgi:hypothetical protein
MLSEWSAAGASLPGFNPGVVEPMVVSAAAFIRTWRLKALALSLASYSPGGPALYRYLQDIQARRRQDADEMLARAIDLFTLYRQAGGRMAGADFLEIGTGWCPWVPLLLRLAGARHVVTLDVNPWLSRETALCTTKDLLDRRKAVASHLAIDADVVTQLLTPALSAPTLEAWLGVVGVKYLAETDVCAAGLEQNGFDGILSSNVLEHVSPEGLVAIHRESGGLLRDGGLIAHRFNPQDHFSFSDLSITGANFLQFSARQWRLLASGLAYHNRLRCRQHRQLVETTGLAVIYERTRPDEAARRAIEEGHLRVHDDFLGMSAEELSDDYMWLVARKTSPRVAPKAADQHSVQRP